MKYMRWLLVLIFLSACTAIAPASTSTSTLLPPTETSRPTETPVPPTPTVTEIPLPGLFPNSVLVDQYDPVRDPDEDLRQAILVAQHDHKRILLEFGGDWCPWCKTMDDFFTSLPALLEFRAANYILVKINVSTENLNKPFRAKYPKIPGYPHLIVLETNGEFLYAQNTGDLEQGDSYSLDKFMQFLQAWAPVQ
jgi:thiol-disulfide isomerase/thioredoxin